jgi:predicted ribosomally synthesized peptide with SipW-like signal peptide
MNKKIILSLAAIAVVMSAAFGATYAYFVSVRTSANNTFSTGNLELALSNGGQYYTDDSVVFGTAGNMAPGETVGPYNLYFKNTGIINGKVKVNMAYAAMETGTDADAFAKKMVIKNVSLDANPGIEQWWAQQIIEEKYASDGPTAVNDGAVIANGAAYLPTIFGLEQITLYFRPSLHSTDDIAWAPGDSHHETLELMLDPSADNNYMGKGINITVTAEMRQVTDMTDAPNW